MIYLMFYFVLNNSPFIYNGKHCRFLHIKIRKFHAFGPIMFVGIYPMAIIYRLSSFPITFVVSMQLLSTIVGERPGVKGIRW